MNTQTTETRTLASNCPRCGPFEIATEAYVTTRMNDWTLISHAIRKMQKGQRVIVTPELLTSIRKNIVIPNPEVQLETLLTLIGRNVRFSNSWVSSPTDELAGALGTSDDPLQAQTAGIRYIVGEGSRRDYYTHRPAGAEMQFQLTFGGWRAFEELQQSKINSRIAFMAMQYGDAELNEVVDRCFRSGVTRAGFELRVLTDKQPAGSIDDQLRVALRTSRFVIADLTHGNKGAYWEAGFAEGLGRPVIYTCRKTAWDDINKRPHFDTNHLVTVIWDVNGLDEAENKLADTIRATLPDEAKMND